MPGMPRDRARTMADVIVEGDLLGHDTHGLDQLAGYLVQIEEGLLANEGEPEVVADLGAASRSTAIAFRDTGS